MSARRRFPGQPPRRRPNGPRARTLVIVAAVATVAVAALIAVGIILQEDGDKEAPPRTVACVDKACGEADAPVTIEEYGDFQ